MERPPAEEPVGRQPGLFNQSRRLFDHGSHQYLGLIGGASSGQPVREVHPPDLSARRTDGPVDRYESALVLAGAGPRRKQQPECSLSRLRPPPPRSAPGWGAARAGAVP